MPYLEETSFCEIYEYKRGLGNRILETNLRKDDLYMLMLKLDDSEKEAAKQAVRVNQVGRLKKSGIAAVRFAFLNNSLETTITTTEKINDGILHGFENVVFRSRGGKMFDIDEAYFKDYFDDQFGLLLEVSSAVSVSAPSKQ